MGVRQLQQRRVRDEGRDRAGHHRDLVLRRRRRTRSSRPGSTSSASPWARPSRSRPPPRTSGLSGSYSFGHTYTTGAGLPLDDKYPAAGGLPAETAGHTYLASPLDLPSGLGGTIDGYAQSTTYDAYGEVTQEEIGTGSNLAYITSTYDPHTLKLTDQLVSRAVDTPADVDEEQYTYDADGNPTSQASTRLGSAGDGETQCFQYNGLDQLSAAWTATDACAATPSASSHSTVGDGLGAASEYWATWSYNVLGAMTSQDQHSLTGGADTTTTDSYGGGSGGPDALTTAATTGGSTATSTLRLRRGRQHDQQRHPRQRRRRP